MEDDSNTHAPVAQSPTIKIFINALLKKDWIMMSADWINAFPQAKAKEATLHVHAKRFLKRTWKRWMPETGKVFAWVKVCTFELA